MTARTDTVPAPAGPDAGLPVDPWAHVAQAPGIRPVGVFVVGPTDGGWWRPVTCQDRDAAVAAVGGLTALRVLASRTRPGVEVFTEWGTTVGPVVADLVEARCWHAIWVPDPTSPVKG